MATKIETTQQSAMDNSGVSKAGLSPQHAPLLSVVLGLVLFGVYLRVQSLGFPAGFSWDEHHFVENARNYLNGSADWNDHPPLGKLFMAAFMYAFGDQPVAWRLASLGAGFANIALAARLSYTVFGNFRAAGLAAAFAAGDGFLIAYSRAALLDGILTSFVLLAALWTLNARTHWGVIKAAFAVGCAASIKVSGAALLVPLAARCLLTPGLGGWHLLFMGVAPLTYSLQFALGLWLTHKPSGFIAVFQASRDLLVHHLALTDMTHPATSRWYTWLLPKRPILLRFDIDPTGFIRSMTTLGNLALWWISILIAIAAAGHHVLKLVRSLASRLHTTVANPTSYFQNLLGEVAWERSAWLSLVWAVALAPWLISSRDSYIYHFLPAYCLGLVFFSGVFERFYSLRPVWGLVALLLVAEVAVFYAPVWGQLPLTEREYHARLFFAGWR